MAELKTQGTEIFLLDDADDTVYKIGKVTGTGDIGGTASDIDITNFDSTAMEYLVGLKDNGTVTIPYNYDPQDATQTLLKGYEGGANKRFVICCSEAGTDPTFTSIFVIPTDRTTFDFTAGVQGMTKGAQVNDIWRGTITLRISGAITEQAAA